MAIIQGAVWGPNDPDSRAENESNWCWSIPLLVEDDDAYGPAEDLGRIQVEGETFSDLGRNSFALLRYIGFQGRAHMSSICWRYDYAILEISEECPNGVMDGPYPDALAELQTLGEIGE